VRYFAYGSNMDPQVMAEASPGAVPVGPGRLDGYRMEFNVYSDKWEGGAVNLEPDRNGHVWGVVWEISDEDIVALDTYIGHPTYYRQERLVVGTTDGAVECFTYRIAHQKGFVRPTDAYLARMRSAIRVQGLPPEALDILEQAARPPSPRISS
jgi:gamma-glutamylcyclotransferase (GGCT)/AIG2-like uncharacterized protein YtfP